ncbi:MAG: hypothetical protein A3F31_02940 [Candidatus Levybacteria bacterium RIFCSPHIGHO2_12_FULL_38_12]|nr:MAG: hypothetical protein A3F31_02940 [Candidatus Levybacteria bacterium RIFCSPHIGHO2_12_FULL_38_12]
MISTSVFSLTDVRFWIYYFYFFIAAFFAFYIPGVIFLKNNSFTFFQKTVLSLVLGMVLWAWQGFVFGYLGMRWMSYVYVTIFFIFWIKKFHFSFPHFKKPDVLLSSIITVGIILQTSILLLTGIRHSGGIYFCCGAIGDNVYHIEIVYQLLRQFPPFEPGMYGVFIHNYHYWAHLVVEELSRVFFIPFIHIQFQYMPIFISAFLGLLTIIFGQIWKLKKNIVFWILFFFYFGGDYIYIVILLLGRGLHFDMGPLENGLAFLNNFPRSYAVIVFLAGLCLLSIWIKKRDIYIGFLSAILLGSAIAFKVYIGILALSGLPLLFFYFIYKKEYRMIFPIVLSFIFALIVYLPVNKASGGLFFTGFWRFEEFIVQPALGLSHLELAREIYFNHRNYLRVLQYDLFFMALFTFSIFGIKLIGFFQNKKSLSILPIEVNIFLLSSILINLFIGFFFQQESGGSNSFNFLVSVYIIISIYAGISVSYWLQKSSNSFKIIIVLLILMGTLPRIAFEEYKNIKMLRPDSAFFIDEEHLKIFEFIKNKTSPESLILSPRLNYLTFLAQRPIFLGDWGILDSHTIDTSQRRNIIKEVLKNPDEKVVYKQLKDNNISHLYLSFGQFLVSTDSAKFLKKVFSNEYAKILQVSYAQ